MRLDYTEFSFGYAFTENLIRSSPAAPTGAPVFPNLVQEATLGYDVNINLPGLPLFFQYKLPELMKTRGAAEISTYALRLSIPFFRMALMRRDLSEQHQRLIDWEGTFPGTVFYAAPCLRSLDEFNNEYSVARIHRRSAFFSPSQIGSLPDDKDHVVAYQANSSIAYFRSEPREIIALDYEAIAAKAQYLFERPKYSNVRTASETVRGAVRSLVSPAMRELEGAVAERVRARRLDRAAPENAESERAIENILVAREMARVDLGADLLIAQPRPS